MGASRTTAVVVVGLLLGLGLGRKVVRADDAPAPAPAGTYAGKDAAWWVTQLRERETRSTAVEALRVIGRPALPALDAALRETDAEARKSAERVLQGLPGQIPEVAEGLRAALERSLDPDEASTLLSLARRSAATPALVEAVLRLTESPVANTRTSAIEALVALRVSTEALLPRLRSALKSSDADGVEAALRALTSIGPPAASAAPDILPFLARHTPRDNRFALGALRALSALQVRSPEMRAALLPLVRESDLGLAEAALSALIAQAEDPDTNERLLDLLDDPRPQIRSQVLQALGTGTGRRLPLNRVIALVRSEDPTISDAAASLLSRMGQTAVGAIPVLLEVLAKRPQDSALRSAFDQLAMTTTGGWVDMLPTAAKPARSALLGLLLGERARFTADPAASTIVVTLQHWLEESPPDATVAQVAQVTLGGLAPGQPEAVEVLARWLTGGEPSLVNSAVLLLHNTEAGRRRVVALLGSERVEDRRIAFRVLSPAMAGQPLPAETQAVEKALGDPDAQVRSEAAWHLEMVGHRAGWSPRRDADERRLRLATASLDLMARPESERRATGLQIYVNCALPLPEAMPALLRLVGDESEQVAPAQLAQAFALTSERLDAAPPVPALVEALAAPSALRRADAALVLATLHRETASVSKALPELLEALSVRVRWRAVQALGALGTEGAPLEERVLGLLEDSQDTVAMAAATALVRVAPGSTRALKALTAVLRSQRPWRGTVVPGVLVEGFGKDAVPALIAGLADPASRFGCLRALVTLGPLAAEALPKLAEMAEAAPNDPMIREAVEAVRKK